MRIALFAAALVPAVLAAYTPDAPEAPPDPPAVLADTAWVWPEHAENLQVLPDSTSAEELRHVMESFTRGLGVRCSSCHVGAGSDFRMWDFASDAKGHKTVARGMMRMAAEINTRLVPASTAGHHHGDHSGGAEAPSEHAADHDRHSADPASEHGDAMAEHAAEHAAEHMSERVEVGDLEMPVSCWTCHRGHSEPEPMPPAPHDAH